MIGQTFGHRQRDGRQFQIILSIVRQHKWIALACVVILGVSLRIVSALYQGDSITPMPGIADQYSYDTLARQVLAGNGFSFPADWWPATRAGAPTAHWSYLYTLYLAGVYALVGLHPLVASLIQAAIAGVLHPWLVSRIGSRLFGEGVGLVAAGITAVYAYFVYYAGALMTETFYILAILWALDLATGIVRDPVISNQAPRSLFSGIAGSAKPWLLLGLALGGAVLLRQVFLLFVPFLFLWILWALHRRQEVDNPGPLIHRGRSVVTALLITAVVLSVLIVPWTIRNYQAFDRFVLLNTNAGYAFFWANHPIHGTDFVSILPSSVYGDLIPSDLRDLNEAALDETLLKAGLRFVSEDPLRYARLSISRVKDYFEFWPSAESSPASNLARVFSFGASLPFMIWGLILSAVRFRRCADSSRGSGVVLLYIFLAVYSLVHLLSWALIRYRLPVDAILTLYAALAITNMSARLTNASFWRVQ